MLELFARTKIGLRDQELGLTPLHIDDGVSSISAILLDEEYYRMLVETRTTVDGVTVPSAEALIPFKAKAWLDLSAIRTNGQHVDEKNIRKHRRDVCRLATLLTGDETPTLSDAIRADTQHFMEVYESDPVGPKSLKLKGISAQQIVKVLKNVYLH